MVVEQRVETETECKTDTESQTYCSTNIASKTRDPLEKGARDLDVHMHRTNYAGSQDHYESSKAAKLRTS